MESQNQESVEIKNTGEVLLNNPDIISFIIRRHSNRTGGVINSKGLQNAKVVAGNWAQKVKDIPNAEVAFYESPSYMVTESGKRPVRASITASLYEQAYTGTLAPARKGENGEPLPGIRTRDSRLGDLFEAGQNSDPFPAFFQAIGREYGGMTPNFWHAYITDSLPPYIQAAAQACHGWDSLRLAENMTDFLDEREKELRQKSLIPSPHKEVVLPITHGETMDAFLYHTSGFLKQKQTTERQPQEDWNLSPEDLEARSIQFLSYNQGFDAHIDGQRKMTLEFADGEKVRFNLDDFKGYLSQQRIIKNSANSHV